MGISLDHTVNNDTVQFLNGEVITSSFLREGKGNKVNIRVSNVNFGQCLIFVYLGLRSILMLCEQAKMGEDGVLAEYLRNKMSKDSAYNIIKKSYESSK